MNIETPSIAFQIVFDLGWESLILRFWLDFGLEWERIIIRWLQNPNIQSKNVSLSPNLRGICVNFRCLLDAICIKGLNNFPPVLNVSLYLLWSLIMDPLFFRLNCNFHQFSRFFTRKSRFSLLLCRQLVLLSDPRRRLADPRQPPVYWSTHHDFP